MSDSLVTRLTGAAGAAYVVLVFVGSGLGSSSPDLGASRSEIVRWAAKQHATTAGWAGVYIEMLGLLSLVVFAAALFSLFRRSEGGSGVLSTTVLGAGLVSAAVKLASAAPMFALVWREHDGVNPQLTTALVDMNNVSFILTWAVDALMLGAVAILVFRTRLLPRWLGWLGAVTAVLLLVSVPVADIVPPLGMLLGFVWFLAAGLVLAIRPRVAPVSEPVPAY